MPEVIWEKKSLNSVKQNAKRITSSSIYLKYMKHIQNMYNRPIKKIFNFY